MCTYRYIPIWACTYTYELKLGIGTVISTKKKQEQNNSARRQETTRAQPRPPPAEAGEASKEARRANSTPNGGPHLELGRLRLKTWAKSGFPIAQTTGQHICTCVYNEEP